jgi:hypothetical protein
MIFKEDIFYERERKNALKMPGTMVLGKECNHHLKRL